MDLKRLILTAKQISPISFSVCHFCYIITLVKNINRQWIKCLNEQKYVNKNEIHIILYLSIRYNYK